MFESSQFYSKHLQKRIMFPWRIGLPKSKILSNQRRFTEWLADHNRVIFTYFQFPAGNCLQFHSASHCSCSEKPQPSGDVSLLRERGPFVTRLKSRGVLRFDGPDTIKFLQGLLTNDLKRLEKPEASEPVPTPNQGVVSSGPIYAAMLNPQGRFLYDLFLYRPVLAEERLDATGSGPGGDPHQPVLLADVDVDSLDELVSHLKKHRLRAKVEIQDVSQDIAAWQHFGGSLVDESNENKDADSEGIGWGGRYDSGDHAAAGSSIDGWRWFKDPRLTFLGFRGLFSSNGLPPLVEADKEVDEQYYLLWRLEEGVPEGPKEIPKGEAMPLEYNLAGLNAISFEKGCYVGQELVARTHHRGVIRKRILPVNYRKDSGEEVQQAVAPKSEIIDADSGKTIGTVTTVLGPRGLAFLRLELALKHSTRLTVKGLEDVYVKVVRPKWWPSEWGHEEEQQAAVA